MGTNLKRAAYIGLTTPAVLIGSAAAASAQEVAPTSVQEALVDGFNDNKTAVLAVGLLAVVPGLAVWAAPQAVTFGKKMYNRARS